MEAEIRKLSRRREGNDSDDEPTKKKPKKSYLEEELAKYSKGRKSDRKKRGKGEEEVLGMLNSFRGKLKNSNFADGPEEDAKMEGEADGGEGKMDVGGEDPGIEVDDDRGFLSHSLHFPKDDGEESRKAERDYEVIDPRERGAKAREEERERKKAMRAGKGGGYRR